MPRPEAIVAEARKWLGTPWRHHGRQIERGCDCFGLIVGVAHGLGLSDADFLAYGPDPVHLGDVAPLLAEHLDPVDLADAGPGHVLHLRWRQWSRHFALLSPRGVGDGHLNMIHAYEPQGRVIEHIYDKKWQRRAVFAWAFRDAA